MERWREEIVLASMSAVKKRFASLVCKENAEDLKDDAREHAERCLRSERETRRGRVFCITGASSFLFGANANAQMAKDGKSRR